MTYRKTKTVAAIAAGMLFLTACSRSEPEQPVADNATETVEPTAEASPEAMPPMTEMNTAAPVLDNAAAVDVPPEPKVAPDAQMLDDADATGMTARVTRDEAPEANGQTAQ